MAGATARTWAGRVGWLAAGALLHAAGSSLWATVPPDIPVSADTETACPPPIRCPEPECPALECPAPVVVAPEQSSRPEEASQAPAKPVISRPPKPSLTLSRMPGTNQLRAGTKWDDSRNAWALTFAYEIPAARQQVATFYRKVLEDAGLQVSTSEGAPDEDGAVPLYLKGRSTGEHAHITVRQTVGEFETRVRVIWRVYAGGRAASDAGAAE